MSRNACRMQFFKVPAWAYGGPFVGPFVSQSASWLAFLHFLP